MCVCARARAPVCVFVYPGKLHYVHGVTNTLHLKSATTLLHFNVFDFHRIGPLVNCWCMRMEAKHSYFKRIAQIGNFKNIPYSVAIHHQRLLCAHLQGKFFDYEDLQSGPCMYTFRCYGLCTYTLLYDSWLT